MSFDQEKESVLSRADRSIKGSVDKQVEGIISFLNSCPDYYTTSSCSGRISVLAPGKTKRDETTWILKSHEPVEKGQLIKALSSLPKNKVWLRMESLILHITSRDLDAAKLILQCAQDSGLKRSGLVLPFDAARILIEGHDKLSAPIAAEGKLLVDNNYLAHLLDEANAKLKKNFERLGRFEQVCKERISVEKSTD